jgi:hypothetical protein
MKWLRLVGILILAFVCSCNKPPEPSPPPPPTPVAKHLAPEGVYYLLQRVGVTTKAGVSSVSAGTIVTLVKDLGDKLRVTDGETEFEVERSKLTNDMDVAELVAKRPVKNASTSVAAQHLAPDGVFFLIERVSIPAESGVVGLSPGTKVQFVRNEGNKVHVTDGKHEFEVAKFQLTNDIDLATSVVKNDAMAQQALTQYLQKQKAVVDKVEMDKIERQRAKDEQAAREAAEWARYHPIVPTPNPLDLGPSHEKRGVSREPYIRRYPNP